MPIKDYITGNVPYLIEYTPYNTGTSQIAENIQDMVTFNLLPLTQPTLINYFIGAENSYVATLTVKNITNNAILDVKVEFDREVFIVNEMDDIFTSKNVVEFTLPPTRECNYVIEIKKSSLDSQANYKEFLSNVKLSITNRENGYVVTRDASVSKLPEEYLPVQITVI